MEPWVTLVGIVVSGFVGWTAGARTERAKARHGRDERRETERRELRDRGAAAIAEATRDLDVVNPYRLEESPREEKVEKAASARERWRRETSAEFMRVAAAHPDDVAVQATIEARLRIDGAFDAAARAAGMRPLPQLGSTEGLRELLDATKAGEPLTFASEDKVDAARETAFARRDEAFSAMEDMRKVLRDAVVSG